MKHFYPLLSIILIILSCNSGDKRKLLGKSDFQRKLNTEFKDASTSPLTKEDLKKFKELEFFPINNIYKVNATFSESSDKPSFDFPTTTNRIAHYVKYGVVTFKINNQDYSLNIYKERTIKNPMYKNNLFIPFFDKTNGKTSYSGGRFIDIKTTDIKKGIVEIDFNKAYNPYCAYSNRYSCPITPRENYLDTEINAGVMKFNKKL